MSPDLITNIVFGVIMVVIGVFGIWIVKWSTDRLSPAADVSRRLADVENAITAEPEAVDGTLAPGIALLNIKADSSIAEVDA